MSDTPTPNPGAHDAYPDCRCPRAANGYGRGAQADEGGGAIFILDPLCPLHATGWIYMPPARATPPPNLDATASAAIDAPAPRPYSRPTSYRGICPQCGSGPRTIYPGMQECGTCAARRSKARKNAERKIGVSNHEEAAKK